MREKTKTSLTTLRNEVEKAQGKKKSYDWYRLSIDELRVMESLLQRYKAGEKLSPEDETIGEGLIRKAAICH